ncbi:MAG: 30S ribosomal protein S9 [Planctomycetota bacterium]|nr:30S ribosomal protein S9 [Planctomycetota bacterium]MDP6506954.1 30S ribosomal protein S9 [Planctomycetota bacterium]
MAEEVADTTEETETKEQQIHWGTGRRKTSIARVRLFTNGSGRFIVNEKDIAEFLPVERLQQIATSPLEDTGKKIEYDVFARVNGGGITGQAGAIRLGVARALLLAEVSLEEDLRGKGHLTRDSRMVERKHYGRRGARRGFQFSKR